MDNPGPIRDQQPLNGSNQTISEGGQPIVDPAIRAPRDPAGGQSPPRPPCTIASGPRSPIVDDIEPVIMTTHCQPCVDRGRHSRCNKTWPLCTKCVSENTEEFCFEGARHLASEEAACAPRLSLARRTPSAPRHTPVPLRSSRSASNIPPTETQRGGSPGRDNHPPHDSRTKSPRPRPAPSHTPSPAADQSYEGNVCRLQLTLAQAQANLTQAQLNTALALALAQPAMLPPPAHKYPFIIRSLRMRPTNCPTLAELEAPLHAMPPGPHTSPRDMHPSQCHITPAQLYCPSMGAPLPPGSYRNHHAPQFLRHPTRTIPAHPRPKL